MGWSGSYNLTLICDSEEHTCTEQFIDEHGTKCRARARKAGWLFWPDGRALCSKHHDEKVLTWRPRK